MFYLNLSDYLSTSSMRKAWTTSLEHVGLGGDEFIRLFTKSDAVVSTDILYERGKKIIEGDSYVSWWVIADEVTAGNAHEELYKRYGDYCEDIEDKCSRAVQVFVKICEALCNESVPVYYLD